jgi:hypothetical protein
MTRQEQIKDVIASSVECNEHKETAVTSVKQSILKETSTEATGKMNCDIIDCNLQEFRELISSTLSIRFSIPFELEINILILNNN